jgi:glutamate/tyrosine decarboxylase-like PLP-dependent enzyme
MIARLFNAPSHDEANTIGTSTIGSSEAIMVCLHQKRSKQKLIFYSWLCWP